MYQKPVAEKFADTSDDEPDIDIGKLLKDVELFGNYSKLFLSLATKALFIPHTQKL